VAWENGGKRKNPTHSWRSVTNQFNPKRKSSPQPVGEGGEGGKSWGGESFTLTLSMESEMRLCGGVLLREGEGERKERRPPLASGKRGEKKEGRKDATPFS